MESMKDKTSSQATAKQDEPDLYPEEELTEGNWNTPNVKAIDVKVVTGEEEENIFWSHRARLYRWNDNQWKQRGSGEAKLLEDKQTKKIRFLMRQDKTLKVVANHYVLSSDGFCKLSLNSGSDRIWVWAVMDFAEDSIQSEQFALKFATIEQANMFREKFNEASDRNKTIYYKAMGDMNAEKGKEETGESVKTNNEQKEENKESNTEQKEENTDSNNEQKEEKKELSNDQNDEPKETKKEQTTTTGTA